MGYFLILSSPDLPFDLQTCTTLIRLSCHLPSWKMYLSRVIAELHELGEAEDYMWCLEVGHSAEICLLQQWFRDTKNNDTLFIGLIYLFHIIIFFFCFNKNQMYSFFFVLCSCQFELLRGARLTVLEFKIL